MAEADPEAAARAALRARQGMGARFDAAKAAEDLLLARRGAAYYARQLNLVTEGGLLQPLGPLGKTRAHLVAEMSFQARTLAFALKGLREGLTAEEAAWRPDIALAATLPDRALRSLYHHSDVHLNVEFRDLPEEKWDEEVSVAGAAPVPVRDLPLERARALWFGAVALAGGRGEQDIPEALR